MKLEGLSKDLIYIGRAASRGFKSFRVVEKKLFTLNEDIPITFYQSFVLELTSINGYFG